MLMDENTLKSKFLGALVGTAIGDALGAPFEGWRSVDFKEIEETARGLSTLIYTDDTHMMIGIAESLVRSRGFDGQDMAWAFAHNYEREPYRGYGPGPPYIFRLMRAGMPWDQAAEKLYRGGSYGNGSAMRIAPIGVLYHHDPSLLKQVASQSSQITHTHRLGKDGAALQALAISLATNLESPSALNREDFLARLTAYIQDEVYKQKLDIVRRLLAGVDRSRVAVELGNGIEAFNSVPAAIYCFLAEPRSFNRAVLLAISLGGDTDTIGAMTGAIAGACLGVESIPAGWREKLENRLYIEELADKLFTLHIYNKRGGQ
jgi:poly(ADP-ribose) glycohydrolase ARH3